MILDSAVEDGTHSILLVAFVRPADDGPYLESGGGEGIGIKPCADMTEMIAVRREHNAAIGFTPFVHVS